MKKLQLLAICLISCALVSAQKNYSIVYEQSSLLTNDPAIEKIGYWKLWLVINDSVSYTKYWHDANDTALEIVGNEFVGHSNFKNYNTKKLIDQSQPRDNPKLRIIDSIITEEWVLDTTELKTILSYTCHKANLVNEQGHIVTAWYTTSLPKYHSPTTYDGLPGTILEITDYHTKYLMRATSIAQRYVQVVEPTHGKQVTRENARERIMKIYE